MATQKLITGERIISPKGRLSYPSLFKPDTGGQYSDNKFKCTLLFDKSNAEIVAGLKVLKAACLKVAKEAFGTTDNVTMPFKSGDDKESESYKGMVYITAKSKYRPQVVGADPKVQLDEADVYAGCYVRVSLTPASYSAKGTKGVTFYLGNVQKLGDGEPLSGGSTAASDDFEPMPVGDEDLPFEEGEDSLGF